MNQLFLRDVAGRLAAFAPRSAVDLLRRLAPGVGDREAAQHLLASDPAAARDIYRRLVGRSPGHPMHWIGLGLAEASLGRFDAAQNAAEEAQRRVGTRAEVCLPLADLKQKLGQTREALELVFKGLNAVEQVAPSAPVRSRAARYAQRLGNHAAAVQLLEPLVASGSADGERWTQFLHAHMSLHGEVQTRAISRSYAQRLGDAMPLAGLMEVYAGLGRRREARLINRYLLRLWPHSADFARRYASELAHAGLVLQADRLLKRLYAEHPTEELEREFCQRAYTSGEYAEAAHRYRWLSHRKPDDVGLYIALGYALANVEGIDAAEEHFLRATYTLQNYSALVALAHMAMRRKDRLLIRKRWHDVNVAFPSDVTSITEQARALFDGGEPQQALALLEAWRLENAPHRAIDEYRAWLLTNAGRFEAALAASRQLALSGPSWTVAEIMVQCSGLLNAIDMSLTEIEQALPPVATDVDVRHLYSVLRLFEYFERAAIGLNLVLPRLGGAVRLDWAWPYLLTHERETKDASWPRLLSTKAEGDHDELKAKVGDAAFARLRSLDDSQVTAILAQSARSRPSLHIINMFEQASGGSELHALDLGERLTPYADVSLWAPEFPHPLLHADYGVKPIDPSADEYPRGGVLVFIGVYFSLGPWLRLSRPSRILVLYNTFDAVRLSSFVRTLSEMTGCKVELLFCSEMMGRECGLPGLFEPSPIDLAAFPPRTDWENESFVIGRHSRDVPEKHSPADGEVYAAMIARGAHVSLLGATCMQEVFGHDPALRLRPAQRGGIREYLQTLDVFYYRTGTWIEPWGRVVIEAMALGLPAVVHERGGYAEAIDSGVDGFVFRTSEEAIDHLTRLKDDVALRARIGHAGRRKVEALLGEAALKRLLAVYLVDAAPV